MIYLTGALFLFIFSSYWLFLDLSASRYSAPVSSATEDGIIYQKRFLLEVKGIRRGGIDICYQYNKTPSLHFTFKTHVLSQKKTLPLTLSLSLYGNEKNILERLFFSGQIEDEGKRTGQEEVKLSAMIGEKEIHGIWHSSMGERSFNFSHPLRIVLLNILDPWNAGGDVRVPYISGEIWGPWVRLIRSDKDINNKKVQHGILMLGELPVKVLIESGELKELFCKDLFRLLTWKTQYEVSIKPIEVDSGILLNFLNCNGSLIFQKGEGISSLTAILGGIK